MRNKILIIPLFIILTIIVFIIFQTNSQYSKFSFVVYGDSREGHEKHQEIVNLINTEDADFILHLGDQVNDGCIDEQWNIFLDIVDDICRSEDNTARCDKSSNYLDTTFYPVIGNHENVNTCPDGYFSAFPFLKENETGQRYYSFSHENAYFIMLDSTFREQVRDNTDQYNWLKNQLETAQNYDFIFVSFHHPPYTSGGLHGDDEDIKMYWSPLFTKYNVDMVFNGHNHYYARNFVDGINYITSGGGGTSLYDVVENDYTMHAEDAFHYVLIAVDGQKLNYKVYDEDNNVIDEFSL